MIIGVDPGKSGAIGVIDSRIRLAECWPVPLAGDIIDIREIRVRIKKHGIPRLVVIEKVGAMPGQGVVSMFTFGKVFGQILGMCQAMRWPFILVTPQAWKKEVLAGSKKDKGAAIKFVSSRYPQAPLIQPRCRVPHDGCADALCLAHYGLTR